MPLVTPATLMLLSVIDVLNEDIIIELKQLQGTEDGFMTQKNRQG